MENIILTVSPCGCPRVFGADIAITLPLEDSNLIPLTDINIGWVKFDSTQYDIDQVFEDIVDLLSYLNTTFVIVVGLEGVFTFEGGFIEYSNNENFETAEIMAIIQTYMQRFGMLPDYPTLNVDVIEVADSNVITDPSLEDVEVLQVQVNTITSLPIDATGWIHDSALGTLTFPADNKPSGQIISVLTKQPTA